MYTACICTVISTCPLHLGSARPWASYSASMLQKCASTVSWSYHYVKQLSTVWCLYSYAHIYDLLHANMHSKYKYEYLTSLPTFTRGWLDTFTRGCIFCFANMCVCVCVYGKSWLSGRSAGNSGKERDCWDCCGWRSEASLIRNVEDCWIVEDCLIGKETCRSCLKRRGFLFVCYQLSINHRYQYASIFYWRFVAVAEEALPRLFGWS